ncbi:MAG TPA: hypothetical protein DIV86_06525, partial [Alphaproteobacteria bacterium]|nr:hypothetical protein [Alphaproteobacteria bacterium]
MPNLKNIILNKISGIKTIYPDSVAFEKYIHIERGEAANPLVAFIPETSDELQKIILSLNEIKLGAVIFAGNTGLVSAQRAEN